MSHERDNPNSLPVANVDPLAAALARLEPLPARIDRDRLMYAAGAESRRTAVRLWQLTAGFLAAVGFCAGMAFKQPATVEKVVYVDREPAKPATVPTPIPE